MDLGEFHFGMTVKDIYKSIEFYSSLGFVHLDGDPSNGFCTMKYNNLILTFYQGFFEGNMLNFRAGDVRAIAMHAFENGLKVQRDLEETKENALSIGLSDPDGNSVYFCEYPNERNRFIERGKL